MTFIEYVASAYNEICLLVFLQEPLEVESNCIRCVLRKSLEETGSEYSE